MPITNHPAEGRLFDPMPGNKCLNVGEKCFHTPLHKVCFSTPSMGEITPLPQGTPLCDKTHMGKFTDMEFQQLVRARISGPMLAAGNNPKRLASEAGLGETYIRDAMANVDRDLQVAKLRAIAEQLKVPLAYIVGEIDEDGLQIQSEPVAAAIIVGALTAENFDSWGLDQKVSALLAALRKGADLIRNDPGLAGNAPALRVAGQMAAAQTSVQ